MVTPTKLSRTIPRFFTSHEFCSTLKSWGVKLQIVTEYWPQANGPPERFDRSLLKHILTANASKKEWRTSPVKESNSIWWILSGRSWQHLKIRTGVFVSEECVKTYLEHLKLLELKKKNRKKERLEKSSVKAKMTYRDYDHGLACSMMGLWVSKQVLCWTNTYNTIIL